MWAKIADEMSIPWYTAVAKLVADVPVCTPITTAAPATGSWSASRSESLSVTCQMNPKGKGVVTHKVLVLRILYRWMF